MAAEGVLLSVQDFVADVNDQMRRVPPLALYGLGALVGFGVAYAVFMGADRLSAPAANGPILPVNYCVDCDSPAEDAILEAKIHAARTALPNYLEVKRRESSNEWLNAARAAGAQI